jgi:hypothetical protein
MSETELTHKLQAVEDNFVLRLSPADRVIYRSLVTAHKGIEATDLEMITPEGTQEIVIALTEAEAVLLNF